MVGKSEIFRISGPDGMELYFRSRDPKGFEPEEIMLQED
jgi:hypothetical protein